MASEARRRVSLDSTPSGAWLCCVIVFACSSVPTFAVCTIDADCDDANPCTADTCNVGTGVCTNDGTGITVACDDLNACTTTDVCAGDALGTCAGTDTSAVDCNDGNVCTTDTCSPATGCASDGTGVMIACDDLNACTTTDVCAGDALGTCAGTDTSATDCDDLNVCTDDSCNPSLGCQNLNNTVSCADGTFCNGTEVCSGGICQAGTNPCAGANPNLVCNEGLSACDNTCVFDCNFNAVLDTADFGYFLGCFATLINPGDACECADYNGNGAGDTGDFSGFLGCFGQACPCAGALPAMAGPPTVDLRLVVLKGPSGPDYADVPPVSSGSFVAGDAAYAELWVSRGRSAVDDLACVFADLYFDPYGLQAHTIENAERFSLLTQEAVLDSAGVVRNVGGCLGLEQVDFATGMLWARVATVEMVVTGRGRSTSLELAPPSSPFVGVAILGVDRNMDSSRIDYGVAEVRMRRGSLDIKRSTRDGRR